MHSETWLFRCLHKPQEVVGHEHFQYVQQQTAKIRVLNVLFCVFRLNLGLAHSPLSPLGCMCGCICLYGSLCTIVYVWRVGQLVKLVLLLPCSSQELNSLVKPVGRHLLATDSSILPAHEPRVLCMLDDQYLQHPLLHGWWYCCLVGVVWLVFLIFNYVYMGGCVHAGVQIPLDPGENIPVNLSHKQL